MTRGRRPVLGLEDAVPIARVRGTIMHFQPEAESVSDFMINGGGRLVFVRVRKAQRLHGTLEEMEAECRGLVTRLRSLPGSGPVLRELWIYSRYGIWRYFRVRDVGMVEIGPDGSPLAASGKETI